MSEKKNADKKQSVGLLIALLLIVAAVIATCALTFKPETTINNGKSDEPSAALTYKLLSEGDYNNDFDQRGYYVGTAADGSGVVVVTVASGMRSTGGYSISIAKVEVDGEKVTIHVEESAPDPDSAVTMAFTYPIAQVELNRMPKKIIVVDSEGEEFIER